jgi:hypothetical protein
MATAVRTSNHRQWDKEEILQFSNGKVVLLSVDITGHERKNVVTKRQDFVATIFIT